MINKFGIYFLTLLLMLCVFECHAGADELGQPMIFEWTAASGPVFEYAVYVDRASEGYPSVPSQIVPETSVTIIGFVGHTIMVRVAALDDIGNQRPIFARLRD